MQPCVSGIGFLISTVYNQHVKEKLQTIFVAIFIAGAIFWMTLVVTTSFIPANQNPFMPLFQTILGVGPDFQAKPKIVTNVETFDDLLYSSTWYNFYALGSLIVITGLFTLTRGRNLIEKYIMLQAYALPRQRDRWGTVVDRKTRAPIAFAIVRVFRADSGGRKEFLTQTVADLDGKYRLYLNSRTTENFVLEVTSPGYKTYTQKLGLSVLTAANEIRVNVILEKEADNVYINPVRAFFIANRSWFMWFLTSLILLLSLTTFLHAIYSIIFHFNFVSTGNLIFYGFALPWNVFVLWERRKFNPGKMINTQTNVPVAGATMQVFLPNGNKISLLSDTQGIVKFDLEAGEYKAQVYKAGFVLDGKPDNSITIRVNSDGFLVRNILLTPTGQPTGTGSDTLANPFGD